MNTLYPFLTYVDAHRALRDLSAAFGFERVNVIDDDQGGIANATMRVGDGHIMLSSLRESDFRKQVGFRTVAQAGGPTLGIYIVLPEVDAHCARARAAGMEIVMPPTDQSYGSRDYAARDFEGNIWCFGTYQPVPAQRERK